MAIRVQSDFTRKGDVRIIYYNYDDDEALVQATSVDVTIKDPDGTIVIDEVTMDEGDTGVYEYYYATSAISPVGNYQVEVDSLDGAKHSYFAHHFKLHKGINE